MPDVLKEDIINEILIKCIGKTKYGELEEQVLHDLCKKAKARPAENVDVHYNDNESRREFSHVDGRCPECGKYIFGGDGDDEHYCEYCGQLIYFSDEKVN